MCAVHNVPDGCQISFVSGFSALTCSLSKQYMAHVNTLVLCCFGETCSVDIGRYRAFHVYAVVLLDYDDRVTWSESALRYCAIFVSLM